MQASHHLLYSLQTGTHYFLRLRGFLRTYTHSHLRRRYGGKGRGHGILAQEGVRKQCGPTIAISPRRDEHNQSGRCRRGRHGVRNGGHRHAGWPNGLSHGTCSWTHPQLAQLAAAESPTPAHAEGVQHDCIMGKRQPTGALCLYAIFPRISHSSVSTCAGSASLRRSNQPLS